MRYWRRQHRSRVPVTTGTPDAADRVTGPSVNHVAGRVALIVLRWPSAGHRDPNGDAALRDLFLACRMLLDRNGATIVALTADPANDAYRQHGPALIAAAHDSGLNLMHHIVAVTEPATGPNGRREPTSSGAAGQVDPPRRETPAGAAHCDARREMWFQEMLFQPEPIWLPVL
jgi:hypothetical protein